MCNITVISVNTPHKKKRIMHLSSLASSKKQNSLCFKLCMHAEQLETMSFKNCSIHHRVVYYLFIYVYNWFSYQARSSIRRANFIQLLPFHFLFSVHISCRPLSSSVAVICFKRNHAQVITLLEEWIDTSGVHNWKDFKSIYRKLAWAKRLPHTYFAILKLGSYTLPKVDPIKI